MALRELRERERLEREKDLADSLAQEGAAERAELTARKERDLFALETEAIAHQESSLDEVGRSVADTLFAKAALDARRAKEIELEEVVAKRGEALRRARGAAEMARQRLIVARADLEAVESRYRAWQQEERALEEARAEKEAEDGVAARHGRGGPTEPT